MRNFRDLVVWQRAHHLAVRIDAIAALIPARRHPGLAQQLRRAAASVSANIAEGCGHSSRREFARFLQLALASVVEVENHLQFARDVTAISEVVYAELDALNQTVRRMLAALLRVVREQLRKADDPNSANATGGQAARGDANTPSSDT